MNISLPYSPFHSIEWLESFFKENYYKLPYNRFMWWRSYTPRTKPLSFRESLRDRILNGDFDFASFKFEAELVEHKMNEKFTELSKDIGRYVEETSLDRSRRIRLLEDFEKDEASKLNQLLNEFLSNFNITRDQYEEEVVNWNDSLIEFYYYIKEKY